MAVVKDEALSAFQEKLPCTDCKLAGICKYAGNVMPPVNSLPEIFEVRYVCTKKEEFI